MRMVIIFNSTAISPGTKKFAERVLGLYSTDGRTSIAGETSPGIRASDSSSATPLAASIVVPATEESEPSTSTSTDAVRPNCRLRA